MPLRYFCIYYHFMVCSLPFTLFLIHSLHLMIKFYYYYLVLLFYYYHLGAFYYHFFFPTITIYYFTITISFYYYCYLLSSFTVPFYYIKCCNKESVRWRWKLCIKPCVYMMQNQCHRSGISLSHIWDLPTNLWNSHLHMYLPMSSADKIQEGQISTKYNLKCLV